MATYTNNASLSYSYEGGSLQQTTSNDVVTSMQDVYSMTLTKTASPASYRVGENLAYILQLKNTGSLPLNAVLLTDDLASGDLQYVPGSARLISDTAVTVLTPTATDPLSLTLPAAVAVGETVTVAYLAQPKTSLGSPLPDLTNTVTATATGAESVTAAATVTPEQYAALRIVKAADQSVVSPGDTLNYTLTITNSGTLPANSLNVQDTLPANIASVDAVYLSQNGDTETITTDYSYDASTRLFNLPSTGTQSVPAGGSLIIRIQATVGTPS